jgi:hypothetical protein
MREDLSKIGGLNFYFLPAHHFGAARRNREMKAIFLNRGYFLKRRRKTLDTDEKELIETTRLSGLGLHFNRL